MASDTCEEKQSFAATEADVQRPVIHVYTLRSEPRLPHVMHHFIPFLAVLSPHLPLCTSCSLLSHANRCLFQISGPCPYAAAPAVAAPAVAAPAVAAAVAAADDTCQP